MIVTSCVLFFVCCRYTFHIYFGKGMCHGCCRLSGVSLCALHKSTELKYSPVEYCYPSGVVKLIRMWKAHTGVHRALLLRYLITHFCRFVLMFDTKLIQFMDRKGTYSGYTREWEPPEISLRQRLPVGVCGVTLLFLMVGGTWRNPTLQSVSTIIRR